MDRAVPFPVGIGSPAAAEHVGGGNGVASGVDRAYGAAMGDAGTRLVERFNDAWHRGDLTTVAACLAEDVLYSPSAWDGPARTLRGRDAVCRAFADQLGNGPTLGAVRAAGDRVLCEWSWPQAEDGTVLRGVDLYLVRDGLIAAKDVFSKITTDG
ncbi:SnoaL-like protein [Micromonospora taraxaci]|uniref:SnoaL-like protein n=2 Tax=Micromonospora taraxaci TaxID=1316803 RepID=A0A561W7Y0_9ACTN|nr:SnoaL-like protein [Micromonospora taraxaci]